MERLLTLIILLSTARMGCVATAADTSSAPRASDRVVDTCSVGLKLHAPADVRVFLIDASSDPCTITELRRSADWAGDEADGLDPAGGVTTTPVPTCGSQCRLLLVKNVSSQIPESTLLQSSEVGTGLRDAPSVSPGEADRRVSTQVPMPHSLAASYDSRFALGTSPVLAWNRPADSMSPVRFATVTGESAESALLTSSGGDTPVAGATEGLLCAVSQWSNDLDALLDEKGLSGTYTVLIDHDCTLSASRTTGPGVYYWFMPGCTVSGKGSPVWKINSPSHIQAGQRQQIIERTARLRFTNGGTVFPGWWGAAGDAMADDAASIQAAITAVSTNGGQVSLPAGSYRIGSSLTLTSNMRLVGAGRDSTTIIVSASDNGITIPASTWYFHLADFTIKPDPNGDDVPGAAILIHGKMTRNFTIQRVTIRTFHSSQAHFARGINCPDSGSVTGGSFDDIYVSRVREYGIYARNVIQCNFNNCVFIACGAAACASIAGIDNVLAGCTFSGYPVGLELWGSRNLINAPWFEMDNKGLDPNTYAVVIRNDASDYSTEGRDNTFVGGSYAVGDPTGSDGGYVKITGSARNNTWISPGWAHSSGTLIRLKDSCTASNFIGGIVRWHDVVVQDSSANTYSSQCDTMNEHVHRSNYGVPDVDWMVGSINGGVKLNVGADAQDVSANNTPGLYVTKSGGMAPFDATGNLVIKPRNQAGRGVEIWSGAQPAVRARFDETKTTLYRPLTFSGGDLCYDVHRISADVASFDTYGLHIIDSSQTAITGTLADGKIVGQRVKFVCKKAGHNIDIVVAHHATQDPETIRLTAAKQWVELVWDGTDWVETGGSGQTYP